MIRARLNIPSSTFLRAPPLMLSGNQSILPPLVLMARRPGWRVGRGQVGGGHLLLLLGVVDDDGMNALSGTEAKRFCLPWRFRQSGVSASVAFGLDTENHRRPP